MKTDAYSWRIDPQLRAALDRAARREGVPVARIIDRAVRAWIVEHSDSDQAEQERIRTAAHQVIGTVHGGDPTRSRRVRELVRKRLADDHGR